MGVLHLIADDLVDGWVEKLADDGVKALDALLAKHEAFFRYLLEHDPELALAAG